VHYASSLNAEGCNVVEFLEMACRLALWGKSIQQNTELIEFSSAARLSVHALASTAKKGEFIP